MVSIEAKRTAEAHLRLAEGFIATTEVVDTSSEGQIRNAFSRAYYALFHACYAHVLASGMEVGKAEAIRRDHGRLRSTMRDPMGKTFERFLGETYDRRRQADYEADWLVPSATAAQEKLRQVRTHFYWVVREARKSLR
jgi:uncharacterized protein (UPF0332 family)